MFTSIAHSNMNGILMDFTGILMYFTGILMDSNDFKT